MAGMGSVNSAICHATVPQLLSCPEMATSASNSGFASVPLSAICPCGYPVRAHSQALPPPGSGVLPIPKGKSQEEMAQEAAMKAQALAKQKHDDKDREHRATHMLVLLFRSLVGPAAAVSTAVPPADKFALLRLLVLGGATGAAVNLSSQDVLKYVQGEDFALWRELLLLNPIPLPEADEAGVPCVRQPSHLFGPGGTEAAGIAMPPTDSSCGDGSAAKYLAAACKAVMAGLVKPDPSGTNALIDWLKWAEFLAAVAGTAIKSTGAPEPRLNGLAMQITALVHTLLEYKDFYNISELKLAQTVKNFFAHLSLLASSDQFGAIELMGTFSDPQGPKLTQVRLELQVHREAMLREAQAVEARKRAYPTRDPMPAQQPPAKVPRGSAAAPQARAGVQKPRTITHAAVLANMPPAASRADYEFCHKFKIASKDSPCHFGEKCGKFHLCHYCFVAKNRDVAVCSHSYGDCPDKAQHGMLHPDRGGASSAAAAAGAVAIAAP